MEETMFSDSGIIVELKTRKAIIMTKDFNLVKTKRKPYMAIGQKVNLSDLEISEGNGVQPAALMKGLVAVAAIETDGVSVPLTVIFTGVATAVAGEAHVMDEVMIQLTASPLFSAALV